ncbi:hypothetical protein DNTS_031719 [Danionella cerebrum]|uniref:Uncharacterized protein n=1 Tax=Danionella cerebrum TaxID=2873325 RepID=A0A553QB83_9TELE|nr:hypothetical protein DNTS_031719 [Danionella translucida]
MDPERAPENKRSRKPAHPVKRDINGDVEMFAEPSVHELLGWYPTPLQESDTSEGLSKGERNRVSVLKEISVPKALAEEKIRPSSSSEHMKDSPSVALSPSSPVSPRLSRNVIVPLIKPSAVEDIQSVPIVCVWCQKEGLKRFSLLMGSELKSFCSEKCFAACRRAFFKRNKARDEDHQGNQSPPPGQTLDTPSKLPLKMSSRTTRVCDWCKHIRHTRECLAFGSGEDRLQFCSSKCLNQYKMDVFYREARAALTVSKEEENLPKPSGADNQTLLTPEAWESPAKSISPQTSSCRTPHSKICTASPSCDIQEKPRPFQMPRPPIHGQSLKSPNPRPPHNPPHALSPSQRASCAPPCSVSPSQRASYPPPSPFQPRPTPYMPFHSSFPPQIPPLWPQPMMLMPYPVFIPVPLPIPIPIPVSPQAAQSGVIRSNFSEEHGIKMEKSASPTPMSERQVIQCLPKHLVKEETNDTANARYTPNVKSSLGSRIISPASLYSLACSTALQAASFSLDTSSSAQVPSVSMEEVEKSCMRGRILMSTNQRTEEINNCHNDQSEESRVEEDVEHVYTCSVPPKLRERHMLACGEVEHDCERPLKRRCLRIRDQNT